jgi:hypothetical protein
LYGISEWTVNSEENFKISVAQCRSLWAGKNDTTINLGKQEVILKRNTGPRHMTTDMLLHGSKVDDNRRCTPLMGGKVTV